MQCFSSVFVEESGTFTPYEETRDRRTEPLQDLPRAGMGILYAPDPRVTTYSDRGQSSNYAERLFEGLASSELTKTQYNSMKRSGSLSLVLYMVGACLCACMTAASLCCLAVELTTGKMFILIVGYFEGGYLYYNVDAPFFSISAALGFVLTLTLFWSAVGKMSRLKMIGNLKEKSGLPAKRSDYFDHRAFESSCAQRSQAATPTRTGSCKRWRVHREWEGRYYEPR